MAEGGPGHRAVELRFDVSSSVGIEGMETAVTAHLPEGPLEALMFAFPGRGYSRRYYDIAGPGLSGYSQASHHAARGVAVIACDHLGVGDSTEPPVQLTLQELAAANQATVEGVLALIRDGALAAGERGRPVPVVGAGQSMGGCLLTVQQARHRTFDAIALLGWSGLHAVLPPAPGAPGASGSGTPPSRSRRTADLRHAFHWEDVPEAIAAVDSEWASGDTSRPMPPWRSAGGPGVSRTLLAPGIVAAEAAAIDVPVLLAMGERDVCPDPHAEPSAYRSSRDVTLYVLPGAAHMHNFASTRALLWDRILAWIGGCPGSGAGPGRAVSEG